MVVKLLSPVMESSWANPGEREVTTTVAFITSEAQKLHDGIGGSSQFDQGLAKFVPFQPYLQLAEALKFYIPNTLNIEYQGDTPQSWDQLGEKINKTQTQYKDSTDGFWHSLWYGMGDAKDAIDPWVSLIPEAYGLAVVKTGLAVVFKLAGNSAAKRQKIFDTFRGLRDALTRANPTERSFRSNQKVSKCADQLYQAVVESIEDMILVTTKDKMNWRKFIPKFKHKLPPPDPDKILQRVTESTNTFECALGIARDRAIEGNLMVSEYTAVKVNYIHQDIAKDRQRFERFGGQIDGRFSQVDTSLEQLAFDATYVKKGVDENGALLRREREKNEIWRKELPDEIVDKIVGALDRRGEIAARDSAMQDDQLSTRNQLLELLLEGKKKDAEIMKLRQQVYHGRKRGSVVSLDRFCQILAQKNSSEREPVDLDQMFQHPNKDFERALMQKSKFSTAAQGQVQSLLRHNRFLQWMNRHDPDMILVDANIRSSGPGMSAISVFSATFVAGMVKVHPDEVVVHFFCNSHMAPRDAWHGPNGLVRSLIVQLVMKLVKMKILNLDFIDNRDFLMALEEHDLDSLCDVLYSLVSQFPADTTVYCIIDSISSFDKGSAVQNSTFKDLEAVVDWLQRIVEDRSLVPIFKVMMTNPMSSTRRMKELLMLKEYPTRLVNLSPNNLIPMEISSRSVESHLLRPSTPTPSIPGWEVARSTSRGSYRDEVDEGWQTD